MNFEQRQAEWSGEGVREFRQLQGRTTSPVIWRIRVQGDRVFTEFGQEGGKFQNTDYQGKAKNVGKKNEISPEVDALAEARRECRKRFDFGGMDEFRDGVNLDNRFGDGIEHNIPALLDDLPSSFALYKPHNNIDDCPSLLKLIEAGSEDVIFPLKRNGEAMFVILNSAGEVVFYSRRARRYHHQEGPKERQDGTLDYSNVVLWNARFGYLIDQVKALQLPRSSFIAGEICYWRDGYGEDRKLVGSVMRSKTAEAMAAMERGGYPGLYIWDIPFYAGQDLVSGRPVGERYGLIHDVLRPVQAHTPHISGITWASFRSVAEARAWALANKVEGWCAVNRHAVYGDMGYNFTGEPRRPKTYLAKVKPELEDDFIAKWDPDNKIGAWGTGKNEKGKQVECSDGSFVEHGGVGSVALYQYNAKRELVYICDCTASRKDETKSGMSAEFQARLRAEHFPAVWQIQFASRTYVSDGEKTNALEHPRFIGVRSDKDASECVNEDL